jgi:ribonuclease Z
MFGVTILGNNSAVPAYDRHPTAQIVTIHDQLLLLDCGEGTQMQIAKYKIRWSKIKYIFISHLHGDHYFGLIGLLTSMILLGREEAIYIYAPSALKEIIDLQLKAADTILSFDIIFMPFLGDRIIVNEKKFTVECFATKHRIECRGFIIREKKKPRKINKDTISQYQIPSSFYERIRDGEDYINNEGEVIKNEWITIANSKPKSYAFTGDTLFDENIAVIVKDVTLLYHETTYLKDMVENAIKRFHSTTHQAALIASIAGVEKLIIGHFSSKYESINVFLEEAREIFLNTHLAIEGLTHKI